MRGGREVRDEEEERRQGLLLLPPPCPLVALLLPPILVLPFLFPPHSLSPPYLAHEGMGESEEEANRGSTRAESATGDRRGRRGGGHQGIGEGGEEEAQ